MKKMKKNYLFALLALMCNFAFAQVEVTAYKGAFAPNTPMWTDGWCNFNPQTTVYGTPSVVLSGTISVDTTLDANLVYELQGVVTVVGNKTLTIPAGTKILSNTEASVLIITRGSKLVARGTKESPIIFSSKNAPGSRNRGDWGGVVLLGKAQYNINNGINFIEGISQSGNTEFGGGLSPIHNDNSGILEYVRIEYAGFVFAPDNELNGLTMGAVGSGTKIDYVQVSYSNDDSFEWFGGSVNCKHLVAFNGLDDDFDTDNGFNGSVQFGLSVKDPLYADSSTSECFESDNNNSPSNVGSLATAGWNNNTTALFTNFTCIGANKRPNSSGGFVTPNSLHSKALRIRRNSRLNVFNSIFLDFKFGLQLEGAGSTDSFKNGNLKFKNNIIAATNPLVFSGASGWSVATTNTVTDLFVSDNRGYTVIPGSETVANSVTSTTSSGILVRPYATDSETNYSTITGLGTGDTTNIDYRPLSADAVSGASFTDTAFTGLVPLSDSKPTTSALTICKGSTATALTAIPSSPGETLYWYAGTSFNSSKTSITPATKNTGSTTYYVSQVHPSTVNDRVALTVTVVDIPSATTGNVISIDTATAITSTSVVLDVSRYVGTSKLLTYQLTGETLATGETLVWRIPNGVLITAGQGTNKINVSFVNIPSGTLKIGDITVQKQNASGCLGAVKKISISAKLPAAPALELRDQFNNKITNPGAYLGKSTELSLVITNATALATDNGVSSYTFELPTGAKYIEATEITKTTAYYTVYPFRTALTSAPTTVGNTYYKLVTTTYASGIKKVKASKFRVGGTLFTPGSNPAEASLGTKKQGLYPASDSRSK